MTKDQSESELNLHGKTLQVYLYLLRSRDARGIREIQRDVRLSSPSVAEYQIEKLVGLGIAERDQFGRIRIAKKAKARALESHVTVGHFVFPRLVLYAALFSFVAIAYLFLSGKSFSIYGVAVPTAAAGLFWFESARSWQLFKLESYRRNWDANFWKALVPGAVAVAVFMSASVFLSGHNQVQPVSRYVPAPPGDAPLGYVPTPPPTVDDFIQMSDQRAHIADKGGVSFIQHATPELMVTLVLAGALGAGFLAYIIYVLRESERYPAVLKSGQPLRSPIGTQDYPN